MTEETRITHCVRCNLHTRHESHRWVCRPLTLLLLGRVKEVTGWRCTKCGRRIATSSRAVPAGKS